MTTAVLPDFAQATPFTHPAPDSPDGLFDRYYGLEICEVGEDGEMLILGHPGVLRAVAVFRAQLRTLCGREEVTYTFRTVGNVRDEITYRWATVLGKGCDAYPQCGGLGEDACSNCVEATQTTPDDFLFVWDGVTPDMPGAFPVTLWGV